MIADTTLLIWLLLVPMILSLIIFSAPWVGIRSTILIETLHLLSVTSVMIISLFLVRAVFISGPILSLGDWLHLDSLGAVFLLIIGVVGFLVGIYSIGYTRHDLETGEFDINKLGNYYALFELFLFTMLLVVTSNNIIMMWVAVEATTLGSAFLVGIYGHKASLEAAWKYIIICTVGVAFGLYGTVLVYSDAFNVMQVSISASLWTEIVKNTQALDPALIKMAFIFVLVGFGTKAGLFPMHAWLPDAHSEAPSPVSALLSAVLLNCALLVVFRFATISNLVLGPEFAQMLFIIFGMISITAAAFYMFVQRDIKRLLAYSSMENMGLIVLAFGIGGLPGIFAGLLHAINHSLVKSLMFCTSGNILIKYRSRNLDQVKGMLQTIPLTGLLMLVGALALVGTPPLNIFVSKFLIIISGIGAGYLWLMILSLLVLTIVFAAYFRMIAAALFGNKPDDIVKGDGGWLRLTPIVILAVLALVLGIYIPSQLIAIIQSASGEALTGIPFQPVSDALNPLQVKDFLVQFVHFFP